MIHSIIEVALGADWKGRASYSVSTIKSSTDRDSLIAELPALARKLLAEAHRQEKEDWDELRAEDPGEDCGPWSVEKSEYRLMHGNPGVSWYQDGDGSWSFYHVVSSKNEES